MKGYPFYGHHTGILVLNSRFQKNLGNPGHACTFNFPVRYELVNCTAEDIIGESEYIKNEIKRAALSLKNSGIRGIVADCGMMSLYREFIEVQSGLPTITSTLSLISVARLMVPKGSTIGIITDNSKFLEDKIFLSAGVENLENLVVVGMENETHYNNVVTKYDETIDIELMRRDVLKVTEKLMKDHNPEVIILESSSLASFSNDITEVFSRPVFDIVLCAKIVQHCVFPPKWD